MLEAAGHTVVTVLDETSLISACKKQSFDIAVIGQTVSRNVKHRIAMLVKQHCPEVKILELYPPYTGKVLDDADMWLVAPAEVPEDLVARVNELAEKGEQDRARA
jgi:hypothetical protein